MRLGDKMTRDVARAALGYFTLYCAAREAKCDETMALCLKTLNDMGFDVVDKDGKWGLVKKERRHE